MLVCTIFFLVFYECGLPGQKETLMRLHVVAGAGPQARCGSDWQKTLPPAMVPRRKVFPSAGLARGIFCCPLSNHKTHHMHTFFLCCEVTEMLRKSLNSLLPTSPVPYLHEEMWNCGYNSLSPGVHSHKMRWCYASAWPPLGKCGEPTRKKTTVPSQK